MRLNSNHTQSVSTNIRICWCLFSHFYHENTYRLMWGFTYKDMHKRILHGCGQAPVYKWRAKSGECMVRNEHTPVDE